MQPTKLTGLIAATHTPFRADGTLHLAGVEPQAQHLLRQGVVTVFIGGSTGESHSLSLEERRRLAQRWAEVARGTALRVVVHVGANCLADAQALAAQAQELGAAAIAALAPSHFKPRTLDVLIEWCAGVATVAPALPFYYYDIPALTGVAFSMPEFLDRAPARVPTLTGLKFTNMDLMQYQLCLQVNGGVFDLPWGVDQALLGALSLGAQGAVGSTYNFAAPVAQRLWTAFAAGDLATARKEQFRLVQLVQVLDGYGYLGAAKVVMGLLGVDVGPARLPNRNLTSSQQAALRRDLEQLGFFEWLQG